MKSIVSVLAPIFVMEWYLRTVYHVGLLKISGWWFKNHATSDYDYAAPALIGLFFCLLAYFAMTSYLLHTASLAVHGEKLHYAYLGNEYPNQSVFVPADNFEVEPLRAGNHVSGDDLGKSFNYSFSSVFTETIFEREKGTSGIGSEAKSFSFASLLQSVLLLIAFALPMMGILHAYAYPVAINLGSAGFDPSVSLGDAFNALLSGCKLTPVKAVLLNIGVFILIAVIAVINIYVSPDTYGKRLLELPNSIEPGNIIEARPLLLEHNIIRSEDAGNIDTGYRTIVFRFEKDFPVPVYVSAYFDSELEPGLSDLARRHIQNATPLKVKILEDLRIQVVYAKHHES